MLVTGGGGFIGSHLVDALADDCDVRVLDDFSTGSRENLPEGVTLVDGDVRDREAVAEAVDGVDAVFHLAAVVSVDRSVEAPLESHAVNVDGTLAVLDSARRADARVVAVSSAAVYGDPSEVPTPESAPLEPLSPYGVDKLAVDQYARLYADLYGLPAVVVRPFNVYGPRQSASDYSGVVSVFLERALAGDPIPVHGDGEQTRDFLHVSDAVDGLVAAAESDATGEAFNLGTGRQVSVNDLAAAVKAVTDSDAPVRHTDPRSGDVRHSCADVGKAHRTLGFEPSVRLREGLATLV